MTHPPSRPATPQPPPARVRATHARTTPAPTAPTAPTAPAVAALLVLLAAGATYATTPVTTRPVTTRPVTTRPVTTRSAATTTRVTKASVTVAAPASTAAASAVTATAVTASVRVVPGSSSVTAGPVPARAASVALSSLTSGVLGPRPAQGGFDDPDPGPGTSPEQGTNQLLRVITNIIRWIVGILATVATLFLTIGGLRYLMSAGDPGEVAAAKAALKSAAIGYGLAVLAPALVTILHQIVGGT